MFIDDVEKDLADEFIEKGFVIRPVDNFVSLQWIKNSITRLALNNNEINLENQETYFLDKFHNYLSVKNLNDFRVKIISQINNEKILREHYYKISSKYLNCIVGNELAMQAKINLSIQFPNDESSLLPLHSDTWSGDSPFEVVVWLPLVNCYNTKSMYILGPKDSETLTKNFSEKSNNNADNLFNSIKEKITFLDVKFGEVLIFNQNLPHGNIVNQETETRWSMNCRFKSIFSPYGDKKLGEFFKPITLKPASKIGMEYKFPNVK